MLDSEPAVKISVSVSAAHARAIDKHPSGRSAAVREAMDAWLQLTGHNTRRRPKTTG